MAGIAYKKIALIGLGLIASSIALGARRAGFSGEIAGYDSADDVGERARKIGFCDHICKTPAEAVCGADAVILCVPVGAMEELVRNLAPHLEAGVSLIDVGSVKGAVISAIVPHLSEGVYFVPSHPLAGTEFSGPEAGFAELFDNRWCILTPLEEGEGQGNAAGAYGAHVARVEQFWQALGANTVRMDAVRHDLVVAVTSHVPHLIAYTMVGVADDMKRVTHEEVINYSAAGFRDFTRIAASDPTMWRDVFLNNMTATFEVLRRFKGEIEALERAIEAGDGAALFEYFSRTRVIRQNILEAGQDSVMPDFGRLQKSQES